MGIKVGARASRSLQTASNQGMARRVDIRLDGTVNAQAARFETSLAVDGVMAAVWNRRRGHRQCSCQEGSAKIGSILEPIPTLMPSADSESNVDTEIIYDNTDPLNPVESHIIRSESNVDFGGDNYQWVGSSLTHDDMDSYFANQHVIEQPRDKVQPEGAFIDHFHEITGDAPMAGDILESFEEADTLDFDSDDDPLVDVINPEFEDPSDIMSSQGDNLLNSVSLNCPICIGSGMVDGFEMFNGIRHVLDITHPGLDLEDTTVDEDAQPSIFEIPQNGRIKWRNINLPMGWTNTISLSFFNLGELLIHGYHYRLEYSDLATPTVWNSFDFDTLHSFRNGNAVKWINIRLVALRLFRFSHGVLLLSVGRMPRIQVPELNIPNASEFIDWNLSVEFEVSAKIELRENSYITEAKYGRIWKVETVNRRLTASGKSHGYQVGARAIHTFEKAAMALRVYGGYINPFGMDVDDEVDLDL